MIEKTAPLIGIDCSLLLVSTSDLETETESKGENGCGEAKKKVREGCESACSPVYTFMLVVHTFKE